MTVRGKGMPELKAVIEGLVGALAIMALVVMGAALVVFAQAASPRGTPAEIERPQPAASPTKNPHAPHHHFDVRRPHRSTRPKVENPEQKPD